jgi:hypothetical protein
LLPSIDHSSPHEPASAIFSSTRVITAADFILYWVKTNEKSYEDQQTNSNHRVPAGYQRPVLVGSSTMAR